MEFLKNNPKWIRQPKQVQISEDKEGKQRLFEKYEYARENLIQLLHYGLKMTEIIDICGCTAA